MVLIHGVGMDQRAWQPQVAPLSGQHLVVSYDMLGHGASGLPAEGVRLADFAQQLLHLLDQLGIATAHIVGHSMGAMVAQEFALSYPERTRTLLALNAVFQRDEQQRAAVQQRARLLNEQGVQATVESTIARWFGSPVPAHLAPLAALAQDILGDVHPLGYARAYQLFAASDAAHADRLAQLQRPALFFTGELDPNSSPDMSQAMARLVPDGECQVLSGARHMMNLTDAQDVNRVLLEFMGRN